MRNAAFTDAPRIAWSASIGQGNDRKHRISADPVAAKGRVFTLDSQAAVTAIAQSGAVLWQRDLAPASDAGNASGGGLAVAGGVLYAATGFGDLYALDAETGDVIWRQRLDAPVAGAPMVAGKLIYLVTRNSRAWAINTADGRVKWQLENTPSATGVTGAAAPALGGGYVIFPFSSARLAAAFPRGGMQVWEASVAGERLGKAYAQINDVTGDPVIHGGMVFAGSPSGRTVALDLRSGEMRWQAREGAMDPVLVDGGSVFLVSDAAQLVRLDARSGKRIWAVDLPNYVPRRNSRRLRDVYAHHGPVLAAGRLWVASGDAKLRGFDPRDGALVSTIDLPAAATGRPIIVDHTMYLVDAAGMLLALR